MFWQKKVDHINATYQTEAERQQSNNNSTAPIFNIQTANNSVIGINPQGTFQYGITNLEELIHQQAPHDPIFDDLLTTLKEQLKSSHPEKGSLSKFSDLIAKHAWLSGAIAQTLLSYFVAK